MLYASATLVLAFLLVTSAASSLKYNHHQRSFHETHLPNSESRVHGFGRSSHNSDLNENEKNAFRNLDYDTELSDYDDELKTVRKNSFTDQHNARHSSDDEKGTLSHLLSEKKYDDDGELENHRLRHPSKDDKNSPRIKQNKDVQQSTRHRTKHLENEGLSNYDEVIEDGDLEGDELKILNQKPKQSTHHKLEPHTLEEADEIENRHFHANSLLNDEDNMLLNDVIDEDEKLALKHSERVAVAGTCDEPKEMVIHVTDHYPGRYFLPHCTLLHRCGKHSGCCGTDRLKCVAKEREKVTLHFYSVRIKGNGVPPERQIEKLTFTNHTKCGCETL